MKVLYGTTPLFILGLKIQPEWFIEHTDQGPDKIGSGVDVLDWYRGLGAKSYAVARYTVDKEVSGWTTGDWDAWFKKHHNANLTNFSRGDRWAAIVGTFADSANYHNAWAALPGNIKATVAEGVMLQASYAFSFYRTAYSSYAASPTAGLSQSARNSRPLLPKYVKGGKTSGVLRTAQGDMPLTSGWAGPSQAMPKGTPGMNIVTKPHVEGHAAAIMRQQGLREATLYINRVPCAGVRGCDAMLPRMLPQGAKLRVIGPNGFNKMYIGLPD